MIGRVFGRLTVHKRHGTYRAPNGKTSTIWECHCECRGSLYRGCTGVAYLPTCNLTNGNTQSCGCLRRETLFRVKPWLHTRNPGRKKAG